MNHHTPVLFNSDEPIQQHGGSLDHCYLSRYCQPRSQGSQHDDTGHCKGLAGGDWDRYMSVIMRVIKTVVENPNFQVQRRQHSI